jgi:hypothetical protein
VAILLNVNGNATGPDRLLAAVGAKRFPVPVSITNTGSVPAGVELRIRPGSGAKVSLAETRFQLGPGDSVHTTIRGETPSVKTQDTVLEALVGGAVEAEFSLTVVSLSRESIFHNLVPKSS